MFNRTIDDLRRLVDTGVLDEELFDRAVAQHQGLAACWCGYDMVDHDVDELDVDELARGHWFRASGTKHLAWMLGASPWHIEHGKPFPHDHDAKPATNTNRPIETFCLLCRIEGSVTSVS